MKITTSYFVSSLALAALAPMAHAGIVIDTPLASEISFGGRLQADFNHFDNDASNLAGGPFDGSSSEAALRGAKLVLKGKGPGAFDWEVSYDAKSERWQDVKARFLLDGDGRHSLTLGQHKLPSGLETLSSSTNQDFISKATITNSFSTGRRLGASYTYAADWYGVTANCFDRHTVDSKADGTGCAMRGTIAPIKVDGHILHFGVSHVRRDLDSDRLKLSAKPNADLSAIRLIDTGALDGATRVATTGLESFWTRGPLKLQGEYMRVDVDRRGPGIKDFRANGAYLSAVWNVTGEEWKYKAGVPGTPNPADPTAGMWQLGVRYDTIDMDGVGVTGGQMDAITAGVNWYWGNNFKLALNHVMIDSRRGGVADNPNITEARVQFHW